MKLNNITPCVVLCVIMVVNHTMLAQKNNVHVDAIINIDNELSQHCASMMRFEDPESRLEFLLDSIVFPHHSDVLINLHEYVETIVNYSTDSTTLLGCDLIKLLYFLPPCQYADVMRSSLDIYKRGEMSLDLFQDIVTPAEWYTLKLVENYNIPCIQDVMYTLINDEVLIKENFPMVSHLKKIVSGASYSCLKQINSCDDCIGFSYFWRGNQPLFDSYEEKINGISMLNIQ